MSSIFSASSVSSCSSRGESLVYLHLEDGIAPFPLKRAAGNTQLRFDVPTYSYGYDDGEPDDDDDDAPTKLALKLQLVAGALGRLSHALRRRPGKPSQNTESIVFTSPDNWRPGLVTLEQAATRADIVRRPESYERRRA